MNPLQSATDHWNTRGITADVIYRRHKDDEAEWLALRKNRIGASEAAVVLGISPFCSPYSLFWQKNGVKKPNQNTEAMQAGIDMEPTIRDIFRRQNPGWLVEHPRCSFVDPQHPWRMCNLDGIAWNPVAERWEILEIKNLREGRQSEYGDLPPIYYMAQLQMQMMVTGLSHACMAVLFGGWKYRQWLSIPADPAIQAEIAEAVDGFKALLETETPPPIDGSDSTAMMLKALYPVADVGEACELPDQAAEWIKNYEHGRQLVAQGEAIKQESANLIRSAMGNAEIGVLYDGSIAVTLKQDKRGVRALHMTK